jgi:nitroreductase
MMPAKEVLALIKQRRSIFPNTYLDRPIESEVLQDILEAANWAPTHRKTEPWRFKVFQGDARQQIADFMAADYLQKGGAETDMKYKKVQKKPLQSNIVIALCMQRDPEERVPEWEEQMSLAMAVQNMWLMCTAYGIGSYWSSPSAIVNDPDFLGLAEGETCFGLFYMGYHQAPEIEAKRGPIADKVTYASPYPDSSQ